MKLGHVGTILGASVLTWPGIHKDMQEAARQNKSTLWAGCKSGARQNFQNLIFLGMQRAGLGFLGVMALQIGAPLLGAGYGLARNASSTMRQSVQPFSHSFELNDTAQMHLQYGLNSISGTNARLGGEASAMAARYSRR